MVWKDINGEKDEGDAEVEGKHFKFYCFIIALIVTVPLLVTIVISIAVNFGRAPLLQEADLSGVVHIPEKPSFSLDAFLSGEFESEIENYFSYHLATRKTQTRFYNQLLYTLLHSSANRDILVGREDYLFEKSYASAYLTELTPERKKDLSSKVTDLARLAALLNERGVPLVVRISPSKAEHYPEYLPISYQRFVKMKHNGEYSANWYQAFCEELRKSDILVYDRYELMEEMKQEGEIVFAKGGTHWTLAPMAEYLNGLMEYIEPTLGCKLGRMVENERVIINGEMGAVEDDDIWKICWNAFNVQPNYPSPHISYSTVPGDGTDVRVFTVGQSFTTLPLRTLYSVPQPIWKETWFSWYNSRVICYPSDFPWGTEIAQQTDDYEHYLEMDIIIIEFLECGAGDAQFAFVDNMLEYLEGSELSV